MSDYMDGEKQTLTFMVRGFQKDKVENILLSQVIDGVLQDRTMAFAAKNFKLRVGHVYEIKGTVTQSAATLYHRTAVWKGAYQDEELVEQLQVEYWAYRKKKDRLTKEKKFANNRSHVDRHIKALRESMTWLSARDQKEFIVWITQELSK